MVVDGVRWLFPISPHGIVLVMANDYLDSFGNIFLCDHVHHNGYISAVHLVSVLHGVVRLFAIFLLLAVLLLLLLRSTICGKILLAAVLLKWRMTEAA